jgi:serine/threonine-protein kinase
VSHAEYSPEDVGRLTGQVIGGRYRLGERLGQGGMGVVYAATQESLARQVAVKLLQPMLAQSGESMLRFKAEAERAGRLAHPHIVQILDFGHEPNASAWIAMELLRGESLAARIARGRLSEAEVVRIAKETLSALEAAHGAHLVHRDLKPDNIFLADVPGIGTTVKVLDFGIAKLLDDESAGKLTATGMLLGTPLYMAPEQARGGEVDPRADLYALGAVLYEALTGRPPLQGKNYNALLFAILSETPAPLASSRPDVSPDLAYVITRALEKEPAARWQSATEMAQALRGLSPSAELPMVRVPSYAPMAMAATMATPNPTAPREATTLPMQSKGKPLPVLHWWPLALAGGMLATVALAFFGIRALSGPGSAAVAALAPTPVTLAEVSLTPVAPTPLSAPPPPSTIAAPLALPSQPVALPSQPIGLPSPPVALPAPPAALPPPTVELSLRDEPAALSFGDERPATPAQARPRHDTGASPPRPLTAPSAQPEPAAPAPAPGPASGARRPHVRYGGGMYDAMASSADISEPLEATGGWDDCWPRGMPAPVMDRARGFLVDIAGDGQVLSANPAPNNEDPLPFSSCVTGKLRRMRFPATATGGVAHVRINLAIE